ncbi:hypothetical protein [Psychromonas sp. GE-S-Ul-11]|uniref:hypothetical protein n=1 Tax=Psychromonas sp. GE-S-Ul-11 TaxID=3241170 RepID=UPI00390C4C66
MRVHEKYLRAIEDHNDWLTVSEWAVKVADIYPDILKKLKRMRLIKKMIQLD